MKLKAGKEAIQKLLKTQAYKMPNPEVLKFMELLERTNQAIKQLELLIALDEKINTIEKEKSNNDTSK